MEARRANRPVRLLLVEDNPGDVCLTLEAFQEGSVPTDVDVADDGLAALARLRREGPYADTERPDVILLDLNLPGKDGREVLAEIKADPDLRRIPVLILTSSEAEDDVQRCYDLNANCYVVKPVDFQRFTEIVRVIQEYWFRVSTLPPK
jgi:two-component system, chemotaxis family, response regulator Rcp1